MAGAKQRCAPCGAAVQARKETGGISEEQFTHGRTLRVPTLLAFHTYANRSLLTRENMARQADRPPICYLQFSHSPVDLEHKDLAVPQPQELLVLVGLHLDLPGQLDVLLAPVGVLRREDELRIGGQDLCRGQGRGMSVGTTKGTSHGFNQKFGLKRALNARRH